MTFVEDFAHKRKRIEELLVAPPAAEPGDFRHIVSQILERRAEILELCSREPTPLYAYDAGAFRAALEEFSDAFGRHVPQHQAFFAVKSNHHPYLAAEAVRAGLGLDVSSSRELELALSAGAERIVFSGPAKSAADLELALAHRDRVIVNIDSFRELELLGELSARTRQRATDETRIDTEGDKASALSASSVSSAAIPPRIRAGVRIHTGEHGAWSKFGIPLAELPRFWRAAARHRGISLEGIQSHLSWTHDAAPYCRVIADVATLLREQLTPAERAQIKFYDFGGGYRPHRIEGRYPTELPLGELIRVADEASGETSRFAAPYYFQESVTIEDYARRIGAALAEHMTPLVDCAFYSEPGRVVAARAMHLVMRIADKKREGLVIVDGGIHMIGWERYLHVYAPVINLTRPAMREIPVQICGSLCDPEDILGRYCFAEAIEEGDVLVMPYQGAYTYSTAHNFIREIPAVHRLP